MTPSMKLATYRHTWREIALFARAALSASMQVRQPNFNSLAMFSMWTQLRQLGRTPFFSHGRSHVHPPLLECHVQLSDLLLRLHTHIECTCMKHAAYVFVLVITFLDFHNCWQMSMERTISWKMLTKISFKVARLFILLLKKTTKKKHIVTAGIPALATSWANWEPNSSQGKYQLLFKEKSCL